MKTYNMKKSVTQSGIGLLELMLSLAIIAILLVMATRYYESTQQGERLNEAISMFQAMRGAAEQFSSGQPNFKDASFANLVAANLVPKSLVTGAGVGPWGGTLNVAPSGSMNSQLLVSLTNSGITQGACRVLQNRMENYSTNVNCSSGNVQVTFDFYPSNS